MKLSPACTGTETGTHWDPLGSGPAPRLHVFSLKNCQLFWLPKWEVWEVDHKKGTFEQFEQVQALTSASFPASQPPLCQSPLQYQPHRSSLEIDSVQKKCLMCLNSFARNLENVILHSAGQR